jgi:hypothetical protein
MNNVLPAGPNFPLLVEPLHLKTIQPMVVGFLVQPFLGCCRCFYPSFQILGLWVCSLDRMLLVKLNMTENYSGYQRKGLIPPTYLGACFIIALELGLKARCDSTRL